MDNRFLFRGKRIDNLSKDWVVGHYVSVPRHMIVLTETMIGPNWNCFDVDPDTIGQCTGLADKNGKLIFAGDVVSTNSGTGIIETMSEYTYPYFKYLGNLDWDSLYEFANSKYTDYGNKEIIGNRWENPELLEPQP